MKTKMQLTIEPEDLEDIKILARRSSLKISTYIVEVLKIAISKDLNNEPFTILHEIDVALLNYYHTYCKNGCFPSGETLKDKLNYTKSSIVRHKRNLIKNGYITRNLILTPGIKVLEERGLL